MPVETVDVVSPGETVGEGWAMIVGPKFIDVWLLEPVGKTTGFVVAGAAGAGVVVGSLDNTVVGADSAGIVGVTAIELEF